MSIFTKLGDAAEVMLDDYVKKAKSDAQEEMYYDRKGLTEIEYGGEMQYGWKERRGLVGPEVLKNMSRKDSVITSIIQTRLTQVSSFTQPQRDRYSPGYRIIPRKPADFSKEDKLRLADPALDDDAYKKLKYELEQGRMDLAQKQDQDVEKITNFIQHCGQPLEETDTTHRRYDFSRFVKLILKDRLVYNYAAVEVIPTKDLSRIACFYPVSAGTIRYVTKASSEAYKKILLEEIAKRVRQAAMEGKELHFAPPKKEFKYVQVVRGRVMAAWTEDEMVFEAANPTVDPEDNGYAPGELEYLIAIITSHLYAEAHNRNFFTQGIGTKGLLHIKGANISRGQLEAFKRQWFNQLVNSKNAFRPPIIGMADEVKWVELAQSNKDMEFDSWMNYLIRLCCAVYQIDPAEINFDISKVNTSTLNESSNETRLKFSKDKGLRPLLDYVENLINNNILPQWDPKLAADYEFKFVGLDAETRTQEIDRLKKETEVYKTINEARIEMGYPPIDDGDIILAAAFTQFKQMKLQNEQAQQGQPGADGQPSPEDQQAGVDQDQQNIEETNQKQEGVGGDLDSLSSQLDEIIGDSGKASDEKKADDKEAAAAEEKKKAAKAKKPEKTKKSVIEYIEEDDE